MSSYKFDIDDLGAIYVLLKNQHLWGTMRYMASIPRF